MEEQPFHGELKSATLIIKEEMRLMDSLNRQNYIRQAIKSQGGVRRKLHSR